MHNIRDKVFSESLISAHGAIAYNNPCFTVASKCGIEVLEGGSMIINNSASHIKEYLQGTTERLGFAPDLYYLHRIDPSMSITTKLHTQD